MFCWGSAGRLRPVRMCWLERNYNEPRYDIVKWHLPSLRRHTVALPGTKVEWDRETRQRFPGETGKWPLNRKPRPKNLKPKKRR